MKKKTNIIKRNSGFLIGCVLAAGASFLAGDLVMSENITLFTQPETETEKEKKAELRPETEADKTYETDPFTVTASGNIIKGVETEQPKKEETEDIPQTDENGNPIESDEGQDSQDGAVSDGSSSSDGSGDSSGSWDDGSTGSSSDGTGSSSGDSGSSGSWDGGSTGGSWGGDQSIIIEDPGNGDYTYGDGSGSSGGSANSGGSGNTGSSGDSGSSGGSGSSGDSGSATTPSDVIIQGISSRYIDESELYNYSAGQLRLIRNEIFALHGRIFKSQDLADYFSQKSWYVPTYAPEDFDANMFYYLNDYEEANLQVILDYEAALAAN